MPWLWVTETAWNQLVATIQRIDGNTRYLVNIQNLDTKLNQLLSQQQRMEQNLFAGQQAIQQMEQKMAVDLTAANAEIARNTDLVGSIKASFSNLVQQIADLKTASTDPQTQAAIDALVAQLKANDDANAAAIITGTAADPNAPAA